MVVISIADHAIENWDLDTGFQGFCIDESSKLRTILDVQCLRAPASRYYHRRYTRDKSRNCRDRWFLFRAPFERSVTCARAVLQHRKRSKSSPEPSFTTCCWVTRSWSLKSHSITGRCGIWVMFPCAS